MSLIRRKPDQVKTIKIVDEKGESVEYLRLADAARILVWSESKLNKKLRSQLVPVRWTKWGSSLNAPIICRASDVYVYKRQLDREALQRERILSPAI